MLNAYSRLALALGTVCCLIGSAAAQSPSPDTGAVLVPARKEIRALRANPHPPRLDGRLDDEVWQRAHFISDFLQKEPEQGSQPTDSTSVAVVYDDKALYIGAHCYTRDPKELRMHLDRRDRHGPAEQFIVSIDSYLDRRTAYGFGVNTAGVRIDRYNPEDNEYYRDYTFDPVWEARTHVDSVSWTVEMRIPLSQLRFNEKPDQVWGINFNRWIPERNEDIFWVYVPRDETGWSSRFGNLTGVSGIRPSRRIELLPYVASSRSVPSSSTPFGTANASESHAGGDLKMGLGPNMTLDATFNPDFGQVEADPAVVNLSDFEVFFSERRPFFLEGNQLLEGDGPGYYYSRRIGAFSRILGAGKITGRLASGTSLGVLAAVTERDREAGQPLSAYAVARARQQFGPNGSTVGGMITAVHRDLESHPDLRDSFRKRALTGGTDWNLRFSRGTYELRGHAGFSHIEGSREVILAAQTASARYFQRPDADYVTLDSNRTSMTGYSGRLSLGKRAGRHWLWNASASVESPQFELNDVGQLGSADDIDAHVELAWRENKPGKIFRSVYTEVSAFANWNYGLSRQYSEVGTFGEVSFHNFWSAWLWYDYQPVSQSDARTRGGPTMKRESRHSFGGGLNNGNTRTTQWRTWFNVGLDDLDGWLYNVGVYVSTRLGNRIQFSAEPSYRREDQPRQYVTAVDTAGGGTGTYGSRYVFSRIDQSTLSLSLRLNYFFTPDLSLEFYAQPFVASGQYYRHGELIEAGDNQLRHYEDDPNVTISENADGDFDVNDNGDAFTVPNLDFNLISYISNVVVRWEFRRGSTLYLVWQRNLEDDRPIQAPVNGSALWDSFSADGENFFALKISYWIPL